MTFTDNCDIIKAFIMKNNFESLDCLNYSIYTGNLKYLELKGKIIINTLNQYSYCIAKKDSEFRQSLKESDILLPDGVGIVAAARILKGTKIKKIAGADLHRFLLEKLNRERGSCFYLGSTNQTLEVIKQRIAAEYPNIQVESYSPPYKPSFSREENRLMVEKVNSFKPDVLLIGMTAPKQEKWSFQHKNLLQTKMICSIGAVFDFYAGTVERPGNIWINNGLEWFGRLLNEPRRMWKRYLYYGIVFGYNLLITKWKDLIR